MIPILSEYYPRLILGLVILIGCGLFVSKVKHDAYNQGVTDQKEIYEKKLNEAREEYLQNYIKLTNQQNLEIKVFQSKIEDLEKAHEQTIQDFEAEKIKIKDSFSISSADLSECLQRSELYRKKLSEAGVKSDLECFSRSELRERIKRTLDIGSRCDKLAERYNSLLNVCRKN